jgi:hypothetical protein
MAGMLRRLTPLLTAALVWACWPAATPACPFCGMQGQTLTGDVAQASMVLYGTLSNAKLDPNNDLGQGTTELHIEAVIKKHEILGDQKMVLLPRYVPTDKNGKAPFLIFCDVFKGKIDPYRGIPVAPDSDIVKYLQGALAVKDKPIAERLRFFFDYLDNKDIEIANDAFKEFGNADYKDYKDMAHNLPADKIAGWLEDPNTPAFRHGLYASMLGHCGKERHAELLHKLLSDPTKVASSGVDGMLAGYAMLKPKDGWAYIKDLLKDPSKEFLQRYAALRSVRFFWDSRPDVVDKKAMVDAVCLLVKQGDIADLAIEDLRKWGRWETTDLVLDLYGKKSHDVPIVRRAILRFALSCPNQPKAKQLLEDLRKRDPEMVKDAEELLRLENGKTP